MSVLVIAEQDNQSIKPATLNAVTAAQQLGDDIHLLVVGQDCEQAAHEASSIEHISKVLIANAEQYQHQLPEVVSPLIVDLASNYQYLVMAATTTGKNLMPRVAALLDTAQISDIVAVKSEDTFVRPIYAGNIMATVQSEDSIKAITVRTTAFEAASIGSNTAPVEPVDTASTVTAGSRFVAESLTESERPELTSADIVISGGRGLGSGENFALLEDVADKLGAAIGASRAAVDAGFVPNDYQVGQTGKIVAPKLYIAVGISGAIQHLAGMKESGTIVAINKDEDAPIFDVADYGIVGDLFQVLPELSAELGD